MAPVPLWITLVVGTAIAAGAVLLGHALWDGGNAPAPPAAVASPQLDPTAVSTLTPDERRQAEYATLDKLRGGMALAYFEKQLGPPLFVRRARTAPSTESTFRDHDYWLQAVSDDAGTVQLMAVTACDAEFHPSYAGVEGSYPRLGHVVLNDTHFDQSGATPNTVHYFTGGTSNSYYYDEYAFGNPGNYKTYFVGSNDACGRPPADVVRPFATANYEDRTYDPSDSLVAKLRAAAVVNTYAETGPFFDGGVLKSFQIGADRILTRTAPPPP